MEVNNQTEMINSLIDTYSNNKFNFQVMPNIDFPSSNSADINKETKFIKPLWFIPPICTNFTQGVPKNYNSRIGTASVKQAIRKSLCGLLKMAGFLEAHESTILTYVDVIDHFYKQFLEKIRYTVTDKDQLNILDLEKAYLSMTGKSLTSLHNHIKNDIYVKNKQEILQFKESFNEYNKLLQENNFVSILTLCNM